MRKALSDALAVSIEAAAEVAAVEGPGLWPNYATDVKRFAAHVETECRGHLDEAEVYVAAHFVIGLTRTAVGRDGLSLLAHWLSRNLGWVDPPTLFDRTREWLERQAELKAAALDDIEELSALVFAQHLDAGLDDEQDIAAEYGEQLFQLAEFREGGQSPVGFIDFTCFKLRTPEMRALAYAVRSFECAYPFHNPPLDSLAKVKAARPARMIKGAVRGNV